MSDQTNRDGFRKENDHREFYVDAAVTETIKIKITCVFGKQGTAVFNRRLKQQFL
jgi:hypothetical protein